MKTSKNFFLDWCKSLLQIGVLAILLLTLSLPLSGASWYIADTPPPRKSQLAQGDPITDPEAILRYALPIDNQQIRLIQKDLEEISTNLRRKRWPLVKGNLKETATILSIKKGDLMVSIPEEQKAKAETLLQELSDGINRMQGALEVKDKKQLLDERQELLKKVTDLEEMMVKGFPFEVPSEYANLPQLLGRATVDMETTKGPLKIVIDGYSAPINGGNFVDLVNRGFYNGLDFTRAEDFFVIQAGDPPGKEEGFIDPKTGEYRAIPLEVLIKGEKEPVYGITLEDAGLYSSQPVLPFSSYGAIALARPGSDPNGGSSQFFFFKFDREITPPGFNMMDGLYSVFGYVIDGKSVLEKLTAEDKIISAKVSLGLENLVQP